MLSIQRGDITSVQQGLILQQVNAQGVMGSGVAKAIRDKWPEVYTEYKAHIHHHNGRYGPMGTLNVVQVASGLYVGNMVGQQNYGRDASVRYTSYDALDKALQHVRAFATDVDNLHIHYPMFGCGLGNGNWSVVKCLIEQHIGDLKHTLWLQ